MKKKDILIISALRKDARRSLTALSKEIKVPISTIHDKIKNFKGRLIKKHTTIIDFPSMGYNTRANILIKIPKENREEIKNHLMKCSHVNSLFKINNGYDYMIDFVFRHIKDMEDYMESFEKKFNIENKKVHYIIEDLKNEGFMNNPSIVKFQDNWILN